MPNDDQHVRPGESVDGFLGRLIDEELERHGFSAPKPAPEADSFEKILADFPEIFGKKTGS